MRLLGNASSCLVVEFWKLDKSCDGCCCLTVLLFVAGGARSPPSGAPGPPPAARPQGRGVLQEHLPRVRPFHEALPQARGVGAHAGCAHSFDVLRGGRAEIVS